VLNPVHRRWHGQSGQAQTTAQQTTACRVLQRLGQYVLEMGIVGGVEDGIVIVMRHENSLKIQRLKGLCVTS
jgi:hypothetical protein